MFNKKHSKETIEKMRKGHPAARPVFQFTISGRLVNVFVSLSEAERVTGVSRRSILRAIQKTSGLKLAGGSLWDYVSNYTEEDIQKLLQKASTVMTNLE